MCIVETHTHKQYKIDKTDNLRLWEKVTESMQDCFKKIWVESMFANRIIEIIITFEVITI